MSWRPSGLLWMCMTAAAPALAQEPQGPPPPSRTGGDPGTRYLELLPDLGRIGAQVGIFAGASVNPYEVGPGLQAGGYIDLPVARRRSGRLSYEITIGLSQGTGDPFTITNPIAYVANLAAGASPPDALAGPPRAPFPVRRDVRTRLQVLQVSPFGLRYTLTSLDRRRLRPYLCAGLDIAVVISDQLPVSDESLEFRGTAPFDAPLIAGLVSQSPELTDLGLPSGQGDFELGGHAAAGLEVRLSRALSVNGEYRFTSLGASHALHTITAALGIHW